MTTEAISSLITQLAHASHAGTIQFGDVVQQLAQVGVESYHTDYRSPSITYYLPMDTTLTLPLITPTTPIAKVFDTDAVKAAIKGAQAGQVKYIEFMQRTMAAGCIGYTVWITGKHVTYYGRNGETHVELFPQS